MLNSCLVLDISSLNLVKLFPSLGYRNNTDLKFSIEPATSSEKGLLPKMEFLTSVAVTILSDDIGVKNRKRKLSGISAYILNNTLDVDGNGNSNSSSKAVRQWCYYAHFYSTLDQPYFNDNEFDCCLAQLGVSEIEKVTKSKWRSVKRLMGSKIGLPRRLSNHFLNAEREKLHFYREEIRLVQANKMKVSATFPFQVNETIHVGDTVIVYFANKSHFCQGCVLSCMPKPIKATSCSQYLIQLEEQSSNDNTTMKPIVFTDEYIYVIKSSSTEKVQPIFQQVSRHVSTSSINSETNSARQDESDISTVNFSQNQINENSSLCFNSQVFSSQRLPSTSENNNFKNSRYSASTDEEGVTLSQNTIDSTFSIGEFLNKNGQSNTSNSVVDVARNQIQLQEAWTQFEDVADQVIESSFVRFKMLQCEKGDVLKHIRNDSQIFELLLDCIISLLVLSQQLSLGTGNKEFILNLSQKICASTDDNCELNKCVFDALSLVASQVKG